MKKHSEFNSITELAKHNPNLKLTTKEKVFEYYRQLINIRYRQDDYAEIANSLDDMLNKIEKDLKDYPSDDWPYWKLFPLFTRILWEKSSF